MTFTKSDEGAKRWKEGNKISGDASVEEVIEFYKNKYEIENTEISEVAKIIADKLGYDLVIENVAFDSIIPGVQSGKYDMGMAGMTVTEDRLESVDFSTSYATGIQAVIVAEDGDIQTIEDLDPYYLPAE